MDSSKGQNRVESTPEQKTKVRKDAEVELSVEELEERISPFKKTL